MNNFYELLDEIIKNDEYEKEKMALAKEIREKIGEWDQLKEDWPQLTEDMNIVEKLSEIGNIHAIPHKEIKEALEVAEQFDNVNKPKHYNREGGMQCIEEMELIFGKEAVKTFCKLNAWKYRYRAADKNGEEDLRKSDWYLNKYKELCNSSIITHTISNNNIALYDDSFNPYQE